MAGSIIPGADDELFQEPLINGPEAETADYIVDQPTGPMDDEDFEAAIGAGVEAAEQWVDTFLSPDRELAARYYNGLPFGNEVKGRSAVVATEVRDAILAMMPGLLRIFTGSRRPVRFEANPGTPSEQADLQTEYVNHVLMRDNNGFEIIHDVLKDALQRKTGVFTWSWEEKEMVTADRWSDLGEQEFGLLQLEAIDKSDADVGLEYEVQVDEEYPDETQAGGDMMPDALSSAEPGDDQLPGAQPTPMIRSGRTLRRLIRKRVRIEAVPPEQFICTPSASRDLDRFALVGRRQRLTIGEIVALGHDEDEVRELIGGNGGSDGGSLDTNSEVMARNQGANVEKLFDTGFEDVDPASEEIAYKTLYALIDYDGDGILERRKVIVVGNANKVLYNEIYDDDMVPFGTICPDPEQHSPFGNSVADWTMDLQEIKSEMLRGTLDSLAESISGARAVNKNNVNIEDALNPARAALIRVNGAPAENIYDLNRPFVGAQTLPVLAYLDEMKTRRTGVNPATPSGMDADAIQSTASEGVQAQVDAAHDREEMIARIFAETGFSRLYRGVRNLVCRHQDFRRFLRLVGKPAIIDPRTWNADLDAVVPPDLGSGLSKKRLTGLTLIAAKQEAFIQSYGPDNGFVGMKHLAYTLGEMVRELGFPNPERFFEPYSPEVEAAAQAKAQQMQSQPSPQQLLLEAQKYKSDKEFAAKMAALTEKREAAIRADASKKAIADQNFALGAAKLLGEYGAKSEKAALDLRQADAGDMHRIADDLNADSPAPEPVPAIPPGGNPQGDA